uniref:Uncharacterized protein n=1 Tax=Coccidioides posadasii RMSCC 3488 TaxID=454284 RepID=A0A0J6IDS3_COCPO|nr:hypothetical protein CPAG_06200 [Coccidioides posadasii RMSCC 3488]
MGASSISPSSHPGPFRTVQRHDPHRQLFIANQWPLQSASPIIHFTRQQQTTPRLRARMDHVFEGCLTLEFSCFSPKFSLSRNRHGTGQRQGRSPVSEVREINGKGGGLDPDGEGLRVKLSVPRDGRVSRQGLVGRQMGPGSAPIPRLKCM